MACISGTWVSQCSKLLSFNIDLTHCCGLEYPLGHKLIQYVCEMSMEFFSDLVFLQSDLLSGMVSLIAAVPKVKICIKEWITFLEYLTRSFLSPRPPPLHPRTKNEKCLWYIHVVIGLVSHWPYIQRGILVHIINPMPFQIGWNLVGILGQMHVGCNSDNAHFFPFVAISLYLLVSYLCFT